MSDGTNPQDPTTDAVVPPPPSETPIPEGLIPPSPSIPDAAASAVDPASETPPPPHIPPADAVIPPPPPEARLRSTRRPAPVDADAGDRPAAAAEDWAQPSIAPEVPTSGGYRVLSGVIFTVLVLVLLGAVAFGVFLATSTSFPWSSGEVASLALLALPPG